MRASFEPMHSRIQVCWRGRCWLLTRSTIISLVCLFLVQVTLDQQAASLSSLSTQVLLALKKSDEAKFECSRLADVVSLLENRLPTVAAIREQAATAAASTSVAQTKLSRRSRASSVRSEDASVRSDSEFESTVDDVEADEGGGERKVQSRRRKLAIEALSRSVPSPLQPPPAYAPQLVPQPPTPAVDVDKIAAAAAKQALESVERSLMPAFELKLAQLSERFASRELEQAKQAASERREVETRLSAMQDRVQSVSSRAL